MNINMKSQKDTKTNSVIPLKGISKWYRGFDEINAGWRSKL